jgi:hypothetical protein
VLPTFPVEEGDEVFSADFLGEGCAVPVVWSAGRQEMSFRLAPSGTPRRFAFSPAGAEVQPLFGDWDCDGDDTPGQYQPRTGMVITMPDLPHDVDDAVAGRRDDSGVIGGRARVVERHGGRCDTVEVTAP